MPSETNEIPLRLVLQRAADVTFETRDMVESCQMQLGVLFSTLSKIPDGLDDLQNLDRVCQMLEGISIMLSRSAAAVPIELGLDQAQLVRGVGLGDLVERVETGEIPILDLEEVDSGEFEAF